MKTPKRNQELRSKLARAVHDARVACGLTQDQLAQYLRLKARAVSRWELARAAPTKANRRAIVATLKMLNPTVGAQFEESLVELYQKPEATPAPPPVPPPDPRVSFELAIFAMADELDLPPRRIRGALVRLLKRLQNTGYSLETAEKQVQAWIAEAQ